MVLVASSFSLLHPPKRRGGGRFGGQEGEPASQQRGGARSTAAPGRTRAAAQQAGQADAQIQGAARVGAAGMQLKLGRALWASAEQRSRLFHAGFGARQRGVREPQYFAFGEAMVRS